MFRSNTIIVGLALAATHGTTFAMSRTTFVWEDVNTRKVLRWEGDVAVVQQGSSMQELECKVTINPTDVEYAISSFGVPKVWTTFTYSDENDLAKKQKQLKAKAANHGILMLEDGNRFSIDYDWVIHHSNRSITDIAKRIRSTARRKGYRSRRDLIGAFASFVQSLEYRVPPDHRVNEEGEKILTAGAMMPLETLSLGWGDCDSKSLLFAALVHSINLAEVCFIVMDEHLFVGVQLSPNQDDQTIPHKGKDWILIELTDLWPIGRVPQDRLHGVVDKRYKIVDL